MKHSLLYPGMIATLLFVAVVSFSPAAVFAEAGEQSVGALQQQIAALLAQIASLKAQVEHLQTGTKPPSPLSVKPSDSQPSRGVESCPVLSRDFSLGDKDSTTGGEVSVLQKFLAQDKTVYPEGKISGFFGPLTRDAVKRWQVKNGVVPSGSSENVGHGMVGPQTRSVLANVCKPLRPARLGGELTIEPSSAQLKVGESVRLHAFYQPPMPPCPEGRYCAQVMPARRGVSAPFTSDNPAVAEINAATTECPMLESDTASSCSSRALYSLRGMANGSAKITASYNNNGTLISATMGVSVGNVHSGKNLPPSIRGVSGPVSLRAGASGRWEVKASDPENQPLSYSVVWGDERVFADSAMSAARSEKAIEQTSSFTHTYNDGGLYRPVFSARDSAGNEEHTSVTVHIGTAPSTQGSLKVIVSDYDSVPMIYCIQAPCPQPSRVLLDYAKVSLYDGFGRFARSVETKDGTVVFDELYPGSYTVRASAPGYTESKESIAVVAGSTSFLEVALHRSVVPTPTAGSLSVDPASAVLAVGGSQLVKAIFTPARPACLDATPACKVPERAPYEVQASFVSDNAKIAYVDETMATCPVPLPGITSSCPLPVHVVRGVSQGNTLITASYTDGEGKMYAAKMKVTVQGSGTANDPPLD